MKEVTSVESENKIFTWICDCCKLEFNEKLGIVLDVFTNSDFNNLNSICPYCNKKIPKPNEKISFAKPYLINEWVKEHNGDIDTFFYDSNIIVDRICRKCHRSYKAKISERSENDQCCPYCSFKKTAKVITIFKQHILG
ncbi:zinc-ribbon domain-containing protein [Streptococcus oralis]|uniref:zinc-ribbon domain-containing protein n=1 Tax=Streptococcus oralis TaxID=1303 RepID=UPI0039C1E3CF